MLPGKRWPTLATARHGLPRLANAGHGWPERRIKLTSASQMLVNAKQKDQASSMVLALSCVEAAVGRGGGARTQLPVRAARRIFHLGAPSAVLRHLATMK